MKYHLMLVLFSICLLIAPLTANSQENRVYIDRVDFSSDDAGGIHTNVPVTFKFGLENNSGKNIFMLANGFRFYSPDGAEWELEATLWNPNYNWLDIFGGVWPMTWSRTGITEDTAGFVVYLEKNSQIAGIPDGFNDVTWYISIKADFSQSGKTICIDSSYFPPIGGWGWSIDGPPGGVTPSWDGPHCYTFTTPGPMCGDVNGNGFINISDLVYLVDYMFRGGPPPPSMWSADWDGNCQIDIGDITYFVHHLFETGLGPVCCDYSF